MGAPAWFAPSARVLVVDEPTGTDGDVLDQAVTSLRIELQHTGVSTVDLTLSNLSYRPVPNRAPGSTDLVTNVPPYRFHDFSSLHFGKFLRVLLRYEGDGATLSGLAGETIHQGKPSTFTNWIPMIQARITNLKPSLLGTGGPTLQIQGEDLLGMLRVKPREGKTWKQKTERQIVEAICQDTVGRTGLTLADAEDPEITQPLPNKQQQRQQTHFDFLKEMAGTLDYELFTAFDYPASGPAEDAPLKLHFERARCRRYDEGELVDLVVGLNIVDFQPTFSVWEQFTEVRGQGRDPRTSEAAVGEAGEDVVREDTPEPDRSDFQTAIAVRSALAGNMPADNPEPLRIQNLDASRARRAAQARLLDQARKFLVAEIETIGLPSLRPGIFVRVKGLYPPFDGYYYVTRARHTFDAGGYKTSLTVRRPGWTDPSRYPAGLDGRL